MKSFLSRLFNLFTIAISIILAIVLFSGQADAPYLAWFAFWYGLVVALNYLVLGRPTLWNGKQ